MMIYPTDLTESHRAAGAVASYQTFITPQICQRKRKQSIRAIIDGILYVVKSDRRSGRYFLAYDAQ